MDITIIELVVIIGVILLSMTLHEVMHGLMAYWLGDDTAKMQGRLTLNPIHHIDPFLTIILPVLLAIAGGPIFGGAKPVQFNPARVRHGEWGVALVGVAGPLVNLLIAFVVFGAIAVSGVGTGSLLGQVLWYAVYINLGFFIFNMLPIPPLDGSRVVYALAPDFIRRAMGIIEQFGIILVFMIVFVASPLIFSIMRGGIEFFISAFQLLYGI